MRDYQYVSLQPENNKTTYFASDNVEFQLSGDPGMSLLKNSIRIEGKLAVKINNNRVTIEKVYYDPVVGVHSFIDSIRTSSLKAGQIENINSEYARYVKMRSAAVESVNDMNNGSNACELKVSNNQMANTLNRGQTTYAGGGAAIVTDNGFSFKPHFCLNKVSPDSGNISFEKNGLLRVSLILSRDLAALFAMSAAGSALTYELSELRLSYIQVPETKLDMEQVVMKSVVPMKQIINSSAASVSSKIPAQCNGVSITFQKQSNEYLVKTNNLRLDNLSGLDEIIFNYNDSNGTGIQYPITDRGEMVKRFINTFDGRGHSTLNPNGSNDGNFGVGYEFGLYKDLSVQKFNTLIRTAGVNNNNQYIIYLYFHSLAFM